MFTRHKDLGSLAHVDETRAQVLVIERKYREAERNIISVIKTFEKNGEAALLADALTVQDVIWARLGVAESSIAILHRAIIIAQDSGALVSAGQATLTMIEEHGVRVWKNQN